MFAATPAAAGNGSGSFDTQQACSGTNCLVIAVESVNSAQSVNDNGSLVLYTCTAVAPGAIFTSVTCGLNGGSMLTSGLNGPAVTHAAIAAGDVDVCYSGFALFPPNNLYVTLDLTCAPIIIGP